MSYDEVEIEDMSWNDTLNAFTYPCPCGDLFQISLEDLKSGEDIARCPSCSLYITVVYDPEDFEDAGEPPKPEEEDAASTRSAQPQPEETDQQNQGQDQLKQQRQRHEREKEGDLAEQVAKLSIRPETPSPLVSCGDEGIKA